MKYSLGFLAFSFLLPLVSAAQDPCNCSPTTPIDNQDRTEAKHVTTYNDFIQKVDTISVSYIYKWQAKYNSTTNTITKKAGSANSQRQAATPEDSLYILKGYMWFVKVEGNDCDFHIEIGPKSSTGTRIVVEVPQENVDMQNSIKHHLDSLGLKILGCGTSSSVKAHFKVGLPCVVIGLGFYDASHKPNTNHGDAHTKKYSWELHPVKEIIFL